MSNSEQSKHPTYLMDYKQPDMSDIAQEEVVSRSLGERFEKLGIALEDDTIVPGQIADDIYLLKNNAVSVLVSIGGIGLQGDNEGSGRKNAYFRHFGKPKNVVPMKQTEGNPEVSFTPYPNTLEVELHSDEQTEDQVQNILEWQPETSELLTTIYTFDSQGNKQKLVFLPDNVADARPSIFDSHLERRGVEGEYTHEDFKHIDAVLALFEKSLSD